MGYKTPAIYNVDIVVTDTEYSQVIPDDVSKVLIKSRSYSDIKLYYTSGASEYITIPAGSAGKYLENLQLKEKTFYFKGTAGDVIEIETWK